MFVSVNCLINIHLGTNPRNGGRPPNDSIFNIIKIINIVVSWGVCVVVDIFVFKKTIIVETEIVM